MRTGYQQSAPFVFPNAGDNSADIRNLGLQHLVDEFTADWITQLEILQVLWIDLNADDQNELIVRVRDSAYCGTIGCDGEIFAKTDESWVNIGGGPMFGNIYVGAPIRQGYRTLWFGDACAVWTGSRYDSEYDDRQDGEFVHSHACGKNYDLEHADATFACTDCHM